MEKNSPLVITISRQLGSGGAYVGQQLAEKLGIFYADREIISRAAKKLSVIEEDLEFREEKALFWRSFIESYASNSDNYLPTQIIVPIDRELFETESEIIEHIANEGSAIIIGRCASYILRDHPNRVSVYLHANMDFRKNRIQELYKISEEAAEKRIIQNDKERSRYNHKYTGKEWTDVRQYDMTIDTSKIGVDNAVELIIKFLELKGVI
jgi:cytidylate kinase